LIERCFLGRMVILLILRELRGNSRLLRLTIA
jgi:hypothetical protein